MWLVGREDAIWLLDLNGYALFNHIPKALSVMGVFSMFAQSVTGRKLQFCDKRDIWPFAQSGKWNIFLRQKGYEIKTGSLTGT